MRIQIPAPKPGLPKVFVLHSPPHMLYKLHWEIKMFKREEDDSMRFDSHLIASYYAANAAITAWHIADWIFNLIPTERRVEFCSLIGMKGTGKTAFQNFIRSECRALHYCRQIATGTKHIEIQHEDENVSVTNAWSLGSSPRFRFVIIDGDLRLGARDEFDKAFAFWERFMREYGWLEDRFIMGDE